MKLLECSISYLGKIMFSRKSTLEKYALLALYKAPSLEVPLT